MADPPFKRPYCDSSLFFALLKKEQDICPDGLTRWQIARHIFDDANLRRYTLFTSTITLAEVRRLRKQAVPLDLNELQQVRDFFEHEYIQPMDVTREIGEKAQILGATYSLEGMDSIHLATAVIWKCDQLLAWDKHFKDLKGTIIEGVLVTEPHWEGQMVLAPDSTSEGVNNGQQDAGSVSKDQQTDSHPSELRGGDGGATESGASSKEATTEGAQEGSATRRKREGT